MTNTILAPISLGELIDKITILEIKNENIRGEGLINVKKELLSLRETLGKTQITIDPSITAELRDINQALWCIEDEIRDHEKRKDFGESFIDLARLVYKQNDQRAAIKRLINTRYNSGFIEEKSYQDY